MTEPSGAPREAYADPDFVIVRMTAVRALGSWEAAGCFQRIAWRCERDGEWTATMAEIADEIGVSLRTAKRITQRLREVGWIESERRDSQVATLTWRVKWAECQVGTPESANLAPTPECQPDTHALTSESANLAPVPESAEVAPGEGQTGTPQSANVALSSTKTGDQDETDPSAAAEGRDLNEGREDVERLCTRLADRIEANGSKRPTIGKRWRDAARLLLDADGRTEEQVAKAIDWCQAHEFWRANILSMPTLREKYDTLRLRAQAEGPGNVRHLPNRHTLPADDPAHVERVAFFNGEHPPQKATP